MPPNKTPHNRTSIVPDGQYLRQLRAKLGLTQLELAFRLDVSERLVRKAEKGKRIDCGSLILFKMFYEQQGLRIDPVKFRSVSGPSSEEIAISFFKDCFVLEKVDCITRWCIHDVAGSIDDRRTVGRFDATVLIKSFLATNQKDTKLTVGPIVSDSMKTAVFWTRQHDHGSTIRERGVALISAQTSVASFDVFTFKFSARPWP